MTEITNNPIGETQETATSSDAPGKHQPINMPQSPRHGATASIDWPLTTNIISTNKDGDDVVWFDMEIKGGTEFDYHVWRVRHRYSEFDYLRTQLEKHGIAVTDFPCKRWRHTDAVIAERKIKLSGFIKRYVLPNTSNSACRAFLEFDRLGEQVRQGLDQLVLIKQAMTAIESELESMLGHLKQAPTSTDIKNGARHALMEVAAASVLELQRLEQVSTQVGKALQS